MYLPNTPVHAMPIRAPWWLGEVSDMEGTKDGPLQPCKEGRKVPDQLTKQILIYIVMDRYLGMGL